MVPAAHVEGLYSCLDYYQAVDEPFSRKLLAQYDALYPGDAKFTGGSGCSGLYRGLRLWAAAVTRPARSTRARWSPRSTTQRSAKAPAARRPFVPGQHHLRMNMYIAQARAGRFEIVREPRRDRAAGARWWVRPSSTSDRTAIRAKRAVTRQRRTRCCSQRHRWRTSTSSCQVFSTAGAEKRRLHGSNGALVFRDPAENDRVWVVFDWDEQGWQSFVSDPTVPAGDEGGRAQGTAAGRRSSPPAATLDATQERGRRRTPGVGPARSSERHTLARAGRRVQRVERRRVLDRVLV